MNRVKKISTIDYIIDLNNLAKFGFGKFSGTEVHIPNILGFVLFSNFYALGHGYSLNG